MLKVLRAFFPALLVGYVFASVSATQVTLSRLPAMGVELELNQRLAATWHDLLGLTSSYLVLLLVAFALAFPIAARLARWFPGARSALFVLAGFTAVLCLHLIMEAALGVNGIAAVRTPLGLLSQCVAGALAGGCYVLLAKHNGDSAAA
jgi:hypothetical protein